jgi:hypothetical protein
MRDGVMIRRHVPFIIALSSSTSSKSFGSHALGLRANFCAGYHYKSNIMLPFHLIERAL